MKQLPTQVRAFLLLGLLAASQGVVALGVGLGWSPYASYGAGAALAICAAWIAVSALTSVKS